ncbi:M48 family metalloprotease [Mycolicibacterium sp. CBM1]
MMLWAVLVAPWTVAALLTLWLPRVQGLFTPQWLTRVLAATGVAVALATWTSALALATIAVDAGPIAARAVGVAVGGYLAWTLVSCIRHAVCVGLNMRAGRLFRRSPARVGDVLYVDSDIPDAFAVPGRRGVVVVTSALVSALDTRELRAVLAHERTHLAGRHPLLIQAVALAAQLNPLLTSWTDAVRFAAERAADERAAHDDRPTALRAIARVALLCSAASPAGWPGIGGQPGEVVRRVDALQGPRPRPQRVWLLIATAAVVAALGTNVVVAADLTQDRIAPEAGESAGQIFG